MRNRKIQRFGVSLALCLLTATAVVQSQTETNGRARPSSGDYAVAKLLSTAEDLLKVHENERAVKILETIIEQYPASPVRYKAYLLLGKHYLQQHEQTKAISYLRHLKQLDTGDEPLTGDTREMYLEALYLTGVAYFELNQYAQAFPILRKITRDYPNSLWANQSYYYIGMCHFAQGNWSKAIEALNLVGTFVETDGPTAEFMEAGSRFYVKIMDADLPVLYRLGRKVTVTVTTQAGDSEIIECIPLSMKEGIFIGSIPTVIGDPKKSDHTLQVVGGDVVMVRYIDNNTQEGRKDVPRENKVQVVSTAGLTFTLGTFESQAPAAFIGQPLAVVLTDADLDKTSQADTATIKVIARYKAEPEEDAEADGVDLARLMAEEEKDRYVTRDEVIVSLKELGDGPIVRSGRFGGTFRIESAADDKTVNRTDDVLTCRIGDEVVATYIDDVHIGGAVPRTVLAETRVASEVDSIPDVSQSVVNDPVIKAKKNLVEATAFLELARIFKDMGLIKGAGGKADEGLALVDEVIRLRDPIPATLKEQAFKLKWELYLAKEDYNNAITTCQLFNRLFPNSPFVDQAMMGIGRTWMEKKEYKQAMGVFQRVLQLKASQVKPEAQFLIAKATEKLAEKSDKSKTGIPESAIRQYKLCADRYPESPYAGESLAKLVDYYISTKDYAQAEELLEQIFLDYQDAEFLDKMLARWVNVAYAMGDYQKAYDKCSQLLFEYPSSTYAAKAKGSLPEIEKRLKASSLVAD